MIAIGIDIGTNSALMVIASVHDDGSYEIINEYHELPRLGENLDTAGHIGEHARTRAREVAQTYRRFIDDVIRPNSAIEVVIVGTSALREASNGQGVRQELESILGWPISVIDGTREAHLTFRGAVGRTPMSTLMIDIGGGSTEYAIGQDGRICYATSTDIGVVRFIERYVDTYPIRISNRKLIRAHVRTALIEHVQHFASSQDVIATAGTPTALAMLDLELPVYDATRIDGHRLSRERIAELADELCSRTSEQLRSIPGLDERRADIVPIGALILSESLDILGQNSAQVSTRGLRHGALAIAIDQLQGSSR